MGSVTVVEGTGVGDRDRPSAYRAGSGRPGAACLRSLSVATQIAVVGGGDPGEEAVAAAEIVGAELARAGAVVVCGGLGGVMAAACRGAKTAGGCTVGILPDTVPTAANQWVDIVVPSGLGEARNALVVGSAGAVVAIAGEYGTLSEIALALRAGVPVIGLRTWSLSRPDGTPDPGVEPVDEPRAAARRALERAVAWRGGLETPPRSP